MTDSVTRKSNKPTRELILSQIKESRELIHNKIEDMRENNTKCGIRFLRQIEKMLEKQEKNSDRVLPKTRENFKLSEESGLKKKRVVLEEYREFLDSDKCSRIDLQCFVCKHVSDNSLQIEENKKLFRVDENLARLLQLSEGDELPYIHIQRHVSHIFDN